MMDETNYLLFGKNIDRSGIIASFVTSRDSNKKRRSLQQYDDYNTLHHRLLSVRAWMLGKRRLRSRPRRHLLSSRPGQVCLLNRSSLVLTYVCCLLRGRRRAIVFLFVHAETGSQARASLGREENPWLSNLRHAPRLLQNTIPVPEPQVTTGLSASFKAIP